jgi:hypothetical protein
MPIASDLVHISIERKRAACQSHSVESGEHGSPRLEGRVHKSEVFSVLQLSKMYLDVSLLEGVSGKIIYLTWIILTRAWLEKAGARP